MQYKDSIPNLILLFSRSRLSNKDKTELENIVNTKKIDWKLFFMIIKTNKVQTVVLNNLIKSEIDLPEEVLKQAKATLIKVIFTNFNKVKELKEVLKILNKNNIPAIPWKGPLLAEVLYENVSFRESVDLDILIQRIDFLKTKDILKDNGFNLVWEMSSKQEETYQKSALTYNVIGNNGITIELHKFIAQAQYYFNISMDDLWKNSKERIFLNEKIKQPSNEYLLVGVAIHHGGVDCWLNYKLVLDWYYLLEKLEVDWKSVLKLAKELDLCRIIAVGTLMVNQLFHTPIPNELKPFIKQKEEYLSKKLRYALFNSTKLNKQSLLIIELRKKISTKCLILYKMLITQTVSDILNSKKLSITFLNRPIRLFNKYLLKKEA